jgi:guanosine-3',5'-bis(diphosphate) 3'-pyrophosphohydrolase
MDAVETNRNTSRILAVLESRAPDIHGDPEISARIVRDTFASLYTDPPRTMRELLAVERMLTMQPIEQISRDALDLIGRALVPAARQLGMWRTAQHVEDACFATLASGEERREVADAQTAIAQGNRAYLPVARDISDLLQQSGLSATAAVQSHSISTLVQSRRPLSSGSKHPCFISLSVDGDEQHCYAALALLHRHWPHIGTQLRDYVGQPKANGYRSIHTVLKIESAARASRNDLEVHLQTLKHEELNVRGIDAYLSIPELRALPGPRPWYAEVPLEEPKDDQMHVFTPAAEQISIACGATILDFAFKLHSELGIHYKRGKINGRIVPRGHELAAGDLCEVDVDPLTAQPAANWENTVRTAAARQAIRTWRNRQARSVSELHDLHQRISDEIAKRGIVVSERAIKDELQLMARERNLDSVALLVDHIREGRLSVKEIAWRLVSRPLLDRLDPSSCELFREFLTDGAIRLAACCQPTYRSAAVAALSRKRTVLTVHRTDCKRVRGGAECAPISWRPEGGRELFCEVSMVAFDRPGLLADVLDVIGARATDDGQVR